MNPIKYRYLFAAIIFLFGLIALGAHICTSGAEYSRYNTGWNGTTAFFSSVGSIPEFQQRNSLDSGVCRTLLVLVPEPGFVADDAYRSFLSRGNRIILVDETAYANTFLVSLNSSLRVVPGNLSSVDNAYNNPGMVHAYPTRNGTFFENVSLFVMNRPAAIMGGEPLAETSLLSWMDENGNGRPDTGETLQRYTVMARERSGAGEVMVIADASLFINGMERENPGFMENIRSTPGLCLEVKDSRTAPTEFLPSLFSWMKDTYIIKLIVVAMVILAAALAGERRYG